MMLLNLLTLGSLGQSVIGKLPTNASKSLPAGTLLLHQKPLLLSDKILLFKE